MKAINSRTGQNQTLSGNASSGIIAPATDNPFASVSTNISLGGNTVDLLNILPDKINYDVDLTVNNTAFNPYAPVYTDFAYSAGSLNAYVNIEVPLSITANELALSDTVDFVSDNFETSVNKGSFTLNINNGFPIGGDLKMYFLNQYGIVTDSVVSQGSILEAFVDSQNRVTEKRASKVSFFIDENRMQNILQARKIVFKVNFSTAPLGSFINIFSDYTIDFKLVGDFNYTFK